MKRIKLNKIALLFASLLVITGCVQDDDFDVPTTITEVIDFPTEQKLSISSILDVYNQENEPVTLEYNSERYMEGYVVSSDEGGNFFKELVLQDAPENPTAAIVVQVDKNPLFTQYEFGRKVFIKLNGLTVAEDNGVIQLGRLDGGELNRIPSVLVNEHVIRTNEVANIIPKEVSISDFSEELESQYIRLTDMQFSGTLIGLTFASEAEDSFDGERLLINCETEDTVILSTSTFSDFKGLLLPANRGSIDGVLTRDFFDDFYTIYINSPEAINFDNPQRCDPVFEEDFQQATDNTTFNFEGWINFAEAGTELWTEDVFGGNGTARFSAFSTGESSNIGWLITPAIDMDVQDGEILTFDMQHAFPDSGHDPIELLYSTDFDGNEANITTATWTSIPFTKSYIEDFGEWFTFVNSGEIDLSGIEGTAYIAFKYTGSDTMNQNMTIDIDNVLIEVPE